MTYSQGTNSYNFAFDYISKYYVKVRINNNDELTYGTHYTVADKTVALNSVVTLSEGDLIEIFRETPTDKTVEWYDSSILRAQDLNLFNVQLMHINEENMDKLLDSGMQEDKLDSKWDARLKPIKNLANPTEDDEAINYGFLKSKQSGYLQASQAKVDEATSKARDAMIQADRAYAQAENAKQNSTNAYNEANRAYSEAERAKGYADKAKTSEDNVTTMKASVEATKTEVDNTKKAVEATKTAFDTKATEDFATLDTKYSTALTEIKASSDAAANSAIEATNKASQASTSATSAANSATNAANSAAEAKTYKDQAKAIVGGDFLTKTDASQKYATITDMNNKVDTALETHNTKPTAHPDKLVKLTTNGNSLRAVKGDGTNVDVVVPYATSSFNSVCDNISLITDLNTALADSWRSAFHYCGGTTANATGYGSDRRYTIVNNGKLGADTMQISYPVEFQTKRIAYRATQGGTGATSITANWRELAYYDEVRPIAAAEVAKLVNSAPSTLDTLSELANALGNDPNFATTVMNQIGTKANADNVYTKPEVDTALGTHNTDPAAHNNIINAIKAISGMDAYNTAPSKTLASIIPLLGFGGIVAQRLDTNGYIKFATGLILQWGLTGDIPKNGTYLVNYPIAFAQLYYAGGFAIMNGDSGSADELKMYNFPNQYSMTLLNTSDNYTTRTFWLAIGII